MRPRILQVAADGSPGGGTTHVLQILRGLKHRFSFAVATQAGSYLWRQARRMGLPAHGLEFFRSRLDPRVPSGLCRAIQDFHPGAVHAHGGRAGFFCALARPPVPMIYTVHGYHFLHKPAPVRWLARQAEKKIARAAACVIFNCRYDLSVARTCRLLPARARIRVIPHGIAAERIPKARTGRKPDSIRHVGFIGRLVPQKNPLLFLEAAAALPGYRATLVGGGPLEKRVRRRMEEIRQRGFSQNQRIRCLGARSREQTLAALSRFGVLLMTSRWEGLPILPLEAMAAGVPVVGPEVGGLPEILETGRSGLLVKDPTPENLAGAVRRLGENPAFRRAVIRAARARVRARFSEERMLRETGRLYGECHV